ncbi:hypothetical protein D3C80_1085230 [compost metagenome]
MDKSLDVVNRIEDKMRIHLRNQKLLLDLIFFQSGYGVFLLVVSVIEIDAQKQYDQGARKYYKPIIFCSFFLLGSELVI